MRPQPHTPILTEQEQKFYNVLRREGRYTIADFSHELGICKVFGLVMSLQSKGIGIASKEVTRNDGSKYELFWLAE